MQQLFEKQNFVFPFMINEGGRISATGGDDSIRGKIIQILFTSRGERVAQPEFGCGLFDLVFDMSDPILASSVEFSIGQSLTRWMSNEIVIEGVNAVAQDENIIVEIAYIKRSDMATQAVSITFS